MPSPVSYGHGDASIPVLVWLDRFAEFTPGVQALDDATVILGWRNEPQPDAGLRVRPEYGGRTRNEGGYVAGSPELLVEVSRATRYVDLGPKLDEYERAGVLEYVVRAVDPDEVLWHVLDGGRFVRAPDRTACTAPVFPGLWLDPSPCSPDRASSAPSSTSASPPPNTPLRRPPATARRSGRARPGSGDRRSTRPFVVRRLRAGTPPRLGRSDDGLRLDAEPRHRAEPEPGYPNEANVVSGRFGRVYVDVALCEFRDRRRRTFDSAIRPRWGGTACGCRRGRQEGRRASRAKPIVYGRGDDTCPRRRSRFRMGGAVVVRVVGSGTQGGRT